MRILVGRIISFLAVILLASNYVYSANIPVKEITKCDHEIKFSKQVANSASNTFFEEDEEEQLENHFYVEYQYNDFSFHPVARFLSKENKWVKTSKSSSSSVPLWLKIRHLII